MFLVVNLVSLVFLNCYVAVMPNRPITLMVLHDKIMDFYVEFMAL